MFLTARFAIPYLRISIALFGRATAGLATGILSYPATEEVCGCKVKGKTLLQSFTPSQRFAVVVGRSSQDGIPRAKFLCI